VPPVSLIRKAWQRVRNPLVLVLLFAAAISAFTGDVSSFVIIATIVVMSLALDSLQEHRAQMAAERLRAAVALIHRCRAPGRRRVASAFGKSTLRSWLTGLGAKLSILGRKPPVRFGRSL
jgi:magnesium-transporting ATPase (P-type)